MIRPALSVFALLVLSGCAFRTQAQLDAALQRHIGQTQTELVRELGVPTRQFDSEGHRFLAYASGHQEIIPPAGEGFGFGGWGGGGYGWGYGGWGYGGWGGSGWGGGFPSEIRSYGCETTWEIVDGRVAAFRRHGNAC